MKKLFIIIACLFFAGCVSTPLPKKVQIIPPSSDVPPKIAAFSGAWKGTTSNYSDTILVVEEIDTNSAKIIYSWSGNPGGYHYAIANIKSGPAIMWFDRGKNKYIFFINDDLESLSGIVHYSFEDRTVKIKMKRFKLE